MMKNPFPEWKVALAYGKSVEGLVDGQVLRVWRNLVGVVARSMG